MKKIIFIELLHHHECLANPYGYFKSKWYQTKAILGEFVHNRCENISKYDNEIIILSQPGRKQFKNISKIKKIGYVLSQFSEMYKNTQKIKNIIKKEKPDFLYINTIESPFLIPLMIYLLFLNNVKLYLAIHNTNRLKVHFLKYFSFDFLIRKLILKSYKIILLWEYLSFKDKDIQKKVIYFNNRVKNKIKTQKFEKITFVMSWHLDTQNKDVESVLKWFSKFIEKNKSYENKIQLVLLWQLNNRVENWINTYKLTNIIKTFDSYVWEADMDKYMSWAHYAILSTYKGSIYGQYKISGTFWDAVWYNLPIILSENYAPDYTAENIIRFNSQNLSIIIEKILIKAWVIR